MSKIRINIEDLFELTSSVIYNPDAFRPVSEVHIDSRAVKGNSIFFALKGNNLDGHKFVKVAVANGASTVVINKSALKNFDKLDCTIVTVPDTTIAYGELAAIWRKKLDLQVVSLTGSNGKTSTKEMLYTILSEKYSVNKSVSNNNNHIGVPLTIFETTDKHDVVVIEHGTNHFNEIDYTAKLVNPDIAFITNIGDSHLEFLINREGVYKEKSALLKHAENNGAFILVNTDDPLLKKDVKKYKNTISYGFKGKPDFKGSVIGFTKDGQTEIKVEYKNKSITTVLPLLGLSNAKNYLVSCAVSLLMGLTIKQILDGTKKLVPFKGRLEYTANENYLLINDTYNASPDSMRAAFDLLKKIKSHKNKILVLGDMFELGKQTRNLHKGLAESFKGLKNPKVYTVGKMMKALNDELVSVGFDSKYFRNRESLSDILSKIDLSDSVILVKGSRGMKMEEFVEVIKARG